jgi:hypothetical protein
LALSDRRLVPASLADQKTYLAIVERHGAGEAPARAARAGGAALGNHLVARRTAPVIDDRRPRADWRAVGAAHHRDAPSGG